MWKKRKEKRFSKVKDLVELLERKIKGAYRKQTIHFATRTFQALRMAVNNEEESIKEGLEAAMNIVSKGGRIVVISFHSGEDRIVKNFFRHHSRSCICPPEIPECRCDHKASLKVLNKKIVIPSKEEKSANPRSRSAKLRAAVKIY